MEDLNNLVYTEINTSRPEVEGEVVSMDDLSTKRNQNVANPESSRDESEGITKEIEELISIEIRDEASNERSGASQNRKSHSHQKRHRIERVPPILLRDKENERYYYPQVVSLGPYHHGEEKLKLVEDFKPTVLEMFVSESGKRRDEFYNAILEVIEDARSCYVQGSTEKYNDKEFANMMLLDGCFILYYIDCFIDGLSFEMLGNHLDSFTLKILEMDMLLIENQLPFQVLQVLMRLKYKDDGGENMINRFIETICSWTFVFNEIKPEAKDEEHDQPFHLYEALRTRLLSSRGEEVNQPGHKMSSSSYSLWDRLRNQPLLIHTFRFLRDRMRKKSDVNDHHTIDIKEYIQSFRSVTELKAKGIFVRPSNTFCYHEVKFKSYWFYGQLELPWCFIESHAKIRFLNHIAYEMCPKNPDDEITSYVAFMKSLIDHPDDVKELRSKRIIFNTLGSDEEVVQMFKEINTYDLADIDRHAKVRDSIHKHYNSKARTWMAELYFTYFSSPWKTIALFGVIFLLVLSVLQTYFSWKALYPHK